MIRAMIGSALLYTLMALFINIIYHQIIIHKPHNFFFSQQRNLSSDKTCNNTSWLLKNKIFTIWHDLQVIVPSGRQVCMLMLKQTLEDPMAVAQDQYIIATTVNVFILLSTHMLNKNLNYWF